MAGPAVLVDTGLQEELRVIVAARRRSAISEQPKRATAEWLDGGVLLLRQRAHR
jgi:hypothetical protein